MQKIAIISAFFTEGATNLVKWSTEQEENLEYFEVERSVNGKDFNAINKQAARNLLLPGNYSFAYNSSLVIYINGPEKRGPGTYFITVEQGSKLKQAKFVKTN